MKKQSAGFLLLFVSVLIHAQQGANNNNNTGNDSLASRPVVRISSGKLRGITEGDAAVFKGIPFATPPVGEFRWRPPQPVMSWEGVRDASSFGPDCAQGGWGTAPGKI